MAVELPELVGGALCLDVANSVDGRVLEDPLDYLATYADLVGWALRAGGLSSAEADALRARARPPPPAPLRSMRGATMRPPPPN